MKVIKELPAVPPGSVRLLMVTRTSEQVRPIFPSSHRQRLGLIQRPSPQPFLQTAANSITVSLLSSYCCHVWNVFIMHLALGPIFCYHEIMLMNDASVSL